MYPRNVCHFNAHVFLLTVTCAVTLLVDGSQSESSIRTKRGYLCGTSLMNTLKKLCNNCYNSDERKKRYAPPTPISTTIAQHKYSVGHTQFPSDESSLIHARPKSIYKYSKSIDQTKQSKRFQSIVVYQSERSISSSPISPNFPSAAPIFPSTHISPKVFSIQSAPVRSVSKRSMEAVTGSDMEMVQFGMDGVANRCCINQCTYNDLKSYCCSEDESSDSAGDVS